MVGFFNVSFASVNDLIYTWWQDARTAFKPFFIFIDVQTENAKEKSTQQALKMKTAKQRGDKAMKALQEKKEAEIEKENKLAVQRAKASNKEKARAKKIAKLPTPEALKPPK